MTPLLCWMALLHVPTSSSFVITSIGINKHNGLTQQQLVNEGLQYHQTISPTTPTITSIRLFGSKNSVEGVIQEEEEERAASSPVENTESETLTEEELKLILAVAESEQSSQNDF